MRLKALAAITAALFIVGCSGLTTEQRAFVSCEGYLAVTENVYDLRAYLNDTQREVMAASDAVTLPVCEDVADGNLTDYREALRIVSENLPKAFAVQGEIEQ